MKISPLIVGFAVIAAILASIVRGNYFVKIGLTQPPGCTSTIPESERVDCTGDVSVSTKGICRSRNCRWCSSKTPNVPHCFYDNSQVATHLDFLHRRCQSCSYCPYAKDCHPEPGATEKACFARGCHWCSSSGPFCGPLCVYSKSANLALVRLNCLSCGSCTTRVDCHPETGADQGKCLTRGCLWCPSSGSSTEPWCIFGNLANLVAEARSKCTSCNDCQARVDCHPEAGATQDSCQRRNCIWCPTSQYGQPFCVYGGASSWTQNFCNDCNSCNTKIDCIPGVTNPSQLQCKVYGCLWCPLRSFGPHKCVQYLL